jgi:hypothetical protein
MGCDYYIIKQLEIYYSEDDINIIEIYRQRGYIYTYDSDKEDYMEDHLSVQYEPKILFEHGKWKSDYIQQKYASFIHALPIKIIKTERRERRF